MKHKYTLHTWTFEDSSCSSADSNAICKNLPGAGQESGESVGHTTELLHKPELCSVRQKQDSFCGAAHNNQYLFCLLWIISREVNISHTYQLSGPSRDASLSTQPENLERKMSQPKPSQDEIVSCTDPPYGFCSLVLKAPENNKLPDIQLTFPFFLISSWYS